MIRTLHSRITILISGYIYTSIIDSNLCQLYAVSLTLFLIPPRIPFPLCICMHEMIPEAPTFSSPFAFLYWAFLASGEAWVRNIGYFLLGVRKARRSLKSGGSGRTFTATGSSRPSKSRSDGSRGRGVVSRWPLSMSLRVFSEGVGEWVGCCCLVR